MKHLSPEDRAFAARLVTEAAIELHDGALDAMLRHLDFVLEANSSVNLTAIDDPREAVRLHVLDSLSAFEDVRDAPAGLMIDMGSGGGFPGVELALATKRDTWLVESVKKKCELLKRFIVQENLDSWISVKALRAEELAAEHPEAASVVTARALASLPSLLELAAPLLAFRGRFVAMKARIGAEELSRATAVAGLCGMTLKSMREFSLPESGEFRTVLVFEKTAKPTVVLPRRQGQAQRKPLA